MRTVTVSTHDDGPSRSVTPNNLGRIGQGAVARLGPVEDGQPVHHQLLGLALRTVCGGVGGVDEGADDDRLAALGQAARDDLLIEALRPADAVDADEPVLAAGVNAAQNPATAQGQPVGGGKGNVATTTPITPVDPSITISASS